MCTLEDLYIRNPCKRAPISKVSQGHKKWYDPDVARLPATQNQSSPGPNTNLKRQKKIRKLLEQGYTHTEIARKLAPDDKLKQRLIRKSVLRLVASDQQIQQDIAAEVKGDQILALPVATSALIKRAARGRVDAIKLLYEASGFHNPRVQHEHSGDIKISLDIPRPAAREIGPGKEEDGQPIVDAEVVEE
jgi:hypothetical protein